MLRYEFSSSVLCSGPGRVQIFNGLQKLHGSVDRKKRSAVFEKILLLCTDINRTYMVDTDGGEYLSLTSLCSIYAKKM